MYKLQSYDNDDVVKLSIDGKIHAEDYEKIVPEFDRLLQDFDKLRLMVKVENFEGIEPEAIWEDLKFFAKHYNDFRKMTIVGDSVTIEWATRLAKPFTPAEVRQFNSHESQLAEQWLRQ